MGSASAAIARLDVYAAVLPARRFAVLPLEIRFWRDAAVAVAIRARSQPYLPAIFK